MQQIKNCKAFEFDELGDERGALVVVESNIDIPFEIKRVFYIYGSDPDVVRGCHANETTEFVLINVCGTSKVMVSDGVEKKVYKLDHPNMGLYIPHMIWKEMFDFSSDSVLLVLASERYNTSEYIRDYEAFLNKVKYDESQKATAKQAIRR